MFNWKKAFEAKYTTIIIKYSESTKGLLTILDYRLCEQIIPKLQTVSMKTWYVVTWVVQNSNLWYKEQDKLRGKKQNGNLKEKKSDEIEPIIFILYMWYLRIYIRFEWICVLVHTRSESNSKHSFYQRCKVAHWIFADQTMPNLRNQ